MSWSLRFQSEVMRDDKRHCGKQRRRRTVAGPFGLRIVASFSCYAAEEETDHLSIILAAIFELASKPIQSSRYAAV